MQFGRQWRGIVLWAAVCAFGAVAAPGARAAGYDQVVERYLAGDAAAREELLEGGAAAVAAVEDRLLAEQGLDPESVRQLVEQLASDSFQERERASRSLERSGDEIVPLLIALREATSSPEARYRLSDVLDSLQSRTARSGLPDMLAALYAQQTAELLPERMELLAADPHDGRGLLFAKLAPVEQVWVALRSRDKQTKMRYLLARLYMLHDAASVEMPLQECSGDELLELAAETYWPVELDPMTRTLGGYHVARAERVEGVRAYNVLSVDLEPHATGEVIENEDSSEAPTRQRQVLSCESFIMWIYLWRYESPPADAPAPVANKGEGMVLGVWGANHVRLVVAMHLDPAMPLPVVRISEREKNFWLTGSALDWARPLIPAEYVSQIRFRDGARYEPAVVVSMPAGATQPAAGEEQAPDAETATGRAAPEQSPAPAPE